MKPRYFVTAFFGHSVTKVTRKLVQHSKHESRRRARRAKFFFNLIWKPHLLLEMKSAGENLRNKQSSYDLFGGLFKQMNDPTPAEAGRFKGVRYFNGGLFSKVDPIELTKYELELIGNDEDGAALKDWSKVNPAIFGTLFEDSMDKGERHAFGGHYTAEADIQRIVAPTIVRPWTELIDAAGSMKQLLELRNQLAKFKVLDPACGSGNFLYVAYREMARLDIRILQRIQELVSKQEFAKQTKTLSVVSPKQFFGIEIEGFGVELAKVTLMLAKKLALDDSRETFAVAQGELALPCWTIDLQFPCSRVRQRSNGQQEQWSGHGHS